MNYCVSFFNISQRPKTKCKLMFFYCCCNLEREKTVWPLLFLNYDNNKKLWLTFGVQYLCVFFAIGCCNERTNFCLNQFIFQVQFAITYNRKAKVNVYFCNFYGQSNLTQALLTLASASKWKCCTCSQVESRLVRNQQPFVQS